jgi:uncharacterized phage infection (PIP) family protein YhgE
MTTYEDFPGVWPGVSAQPVERSGLIGFGVEHPGATPYMSSASKAASKMETTVTREEIDAKLERTEARVQATVADLKSEFAKFESGLTSFKSDLKDDLRSVDTRIEAMQQEMTQMRHSLPSKGFLVGTAISIVAVMIGLAAFGASQFGNGIMAASTSVGQAVTAEKLAQTALDVSNRNAEQLRLISGDLRTIATRLASDPQSGPQPTPQ